MFIKYIASSGTALNDCKNMPFLSSTTKLKYDPNCSHLQNNRDIKIKDNNVFKNYMLDTAC